MLSWRSGPSRTVIAREDEDKEHGQNNCAYTVDFSYKARTWNPVVDAHFIVLASCHGYTLDRTGAAKRWWTDGWCALRPLALIRLRNSVHFLPRQARSSRRI